jgi:hypothetical protein
MSGRPVVSYKRLCARLDKKWTRFEKNILFYLVGARMANRCNCGLWFSDLCRLRCDVASRADINGFGGDSPYNATSARNCLDLE